MDEHLHSHVDKLFRDSLQFHQDDPSGDVWERIKKKLDNDDDLLNKTRTRKRLWFATSLLALLICGSLILIHLKMDKSRITNSTEKNNNGPALQENALENNHQTPISRAVLYPEYTSKNTEKLLNQYFKNLNQPVKNDFSFADMYPVSVETPAIIIETIHVEKAKLLPTQGISDKMIVKPEKQSLTNRLSLTPYFSQEFAGYNLSDDDATVADGREIEERERNVFSASVGIYLNYRLNKRWILQSGISYSWSSSIIDSSTSYAVADDNGNVQFKINTISGYGFIKPTSIIRPNVGDSVLIDKAYSHLHYLTIPFVLSYKFPMNRFSLLVGTGVTFNILTDATVETKIFGPNFSQDVSYFTMKGLKKINYGILLKAELEYHINSRFGFDLIPCFKNTLSPINIHSALSAYPYNFGIGLGISYKF